MQDATGEIELMKSVGIFAVPPVGLPRLLRLRAAWHEKDDWQIHQEGGASGHIAAGFGAAADGE